MEHHCKPSSNGGVPGLARGRQDNDPAEARRNYLFRLNRWVIWNANERSIQHAAKAAAMNFTTMLALVLSAGDSSAGDQDALASR